MSARKNRGRLALELAVLAACWAYLLLYFRPELLASPGVTTGGDTGSHVYAAWYLKNVLLPSGRILGWCPGNLAGYPIFQFYFPLPFLGMAALSWLMPLQAAFKLVTAGGAFALPLGLWLGLRLARAPFPAPPLGAVFSLLFLFNQTNSAYGGNLPSLLAGEFTYSYSLALMAVFLGALWGDRDERRHPVRAALCLAATGLCHGGPLLFGVLAGGLLLFHRSLAQRTLYLGKVYVLAFAFLGFWIVPLLVFAPYNSPHNMVWIITDWKAVLPPLLWPLMAVALVSLLLGLAARLRRGVPLGPAAFFGGQVVLASLLYLVAYHINVIDIRFLPFAWLGVVLWAAWALGGWLSRVPGRSLAPLLALVLVVLSVGHAVSYIPRWITWNYSGFQAAPGWDDYRGLNRFLRGGPADPRVLYEHSILHRRAGTVRAMENLPLFSGRSTLEGLYIQSSPNSPFIYYLQSLTSLTPSTPITGYNYARFDLARARARLRLYNASQMVVISQRVRRLVEADPGFTRQARIGPYGVYRVAGAGTGYVTPLKYKPMLVTGGDWKSQAFEWYRRGDLEVPLIFAPQGQAGDPERFAAVVPRALAEAPRQPLPPARVSSRVGWQEINISTDRRTPLLVKMSYHPNWKVEGAERVFLASPAFMIIYPTRNKVRLYFGQSWPNYLGQVLFGLACLAGLACLPGVRRTAWSRAARGGLNRPLEALARWLERGLARPLGWASRHAGLLALAGLLVLGAGAAAYVGLGLKADSTVAFNRGKEAFAAKDYARAAELLGQAARRYPRSLMIDHILYHRALSLMRLEQNARAAEAFLGLVTHLPESRLVPEALYHAGLCWQRAGQTAQARMVWGELVGRFPASRWAEPARQALQQPAPPRS
ncbi:MAG: tetratricopeptide repeat protein [Desulfarculaceae bacterium]|nr:tetratricopeptide repeat protein [Desulfarculaceae bacterium]MCF8074175.1 tetratricopeptide repeat protein [Desulfarculaceae bacterium]MCF8102756.1 tetratricopeptide repeat protein [Desulfarculaceae bacterium]MCF8116389.1 tetratricopeptide repeat protein [Desulfarculaceae bacterium]